MRSAAQFRSIFGFVAGGFIKLLGDGGGPLAHQTTKTIRQQLLLKIRNPYNWYYAEGMAKNTIRQLVLSAGLGDFDISEYHAAETRRRSIQEAGLIEALPEGDKELFAYLKSHPDRGSAVIQMIIEKCKERLQGADLTEILRAVPRVQMLLQTINDIETSDFPRVAEEQELDAYYESMIYTSNAEFALLEFNRMRDERMNLTFGELTDGEDSALWEIAHMVGMETMQDRAKMVREIAIDVVIWKMLMAWLDAMTDQDVRASETDLFGANQLQLIQGSSGMVLGRSAIEARITKAANRYSGAPLNNFNTVVAQTWVQELFPSAPGPLFWLRGCPFLEKREERRSRKNPLRKNLKIRKVKSWRCDSCTREFPPGESDRDLIPWTFRPDKRVGARAEVTLRDKLPEQAYEESRFMCTCWEQQAGVLHPTFDSSLVTK